MFQSYENFVYASVINLSHAFVFLVEYLSALFGGCSVDVQLGSGWLNYINGYVDKANDAMDFRVSKHYADKEANAGWRQTYRLLCKKAPLLSEVYISMKKRPKMVRSFVTDVLYPVIPGRVDIHAPQATKHHRFYAAYLAAGRARRSADASVARPDVRLTEAVQMLSLVESECGAWPYGIG